MSKRSALLLLEDILEAIESIMEYTAQISEAEFKNGWWVNLVNYVFKIKAIVGVFYQQSFGLLVRNTQQRQSAIQLV